MKGEEKVKSQGGIISILPFLTTRKKQLLAKRKPEKTISCRVSEGKENGKDKQDGTGLSRRLRRLVLP